MFRIIRQRRMKWTGHVTRMRENRNAHRHLVRTAGGKRLLRRPRCRWKIKMDLREI
jgi:hypothetical protein